MKPNTNPSTPKNTPAQQVLRERIGIFTELSAEYRRGEPGTGDWRLGIASQVDAVARELRDILRVLEIAGA